MPYVEIKKPAIKKVVVSGKQFLENLQALICYVWGVRANNTKDAR